MKTIKHIFGETALIAILYTCCTAHSLQSQYDKSSNCSLHRLDTVSMPRSEVLKPNFKVKIHRYSQDLPVQDLDKAPLHLLQSKNTSQCDRSNDTIAAALINKKHRRNLSDSVKPRMRYCSISIDDKKKIIFERISNSKDKQSVQKECKKVLIGFWKFLDQEIEDLSISSEDFYDTIDDLYQATENPEGNIISEITDTVINYALKYPEHYFFDAFYYRAWRLQEALHKK